jgi:hypothetical protein
MHLLPWLLAVTTVPATTTADVEAAARGYRVEIYAQFHTEREAYDRHIDAADDLLHRWEESGRGDRDAEAVAEWLRTARQAVINGAQTPAIPELMRVEAIKDNAATPPNSGKAPQLDEFADFAGPDDAAASQDTSERDTVEQGTERSSENGNASDRESAGAIDGIGRALRGLLAP